MKTTTLAFLSLLGSAVAQGVTDKISPKASAPAGCVPSYTGNFEVTIVDVGAAKRDVEITRRAACSGDGILVASLTGGTILDAKSRVGYIAANYQFQFDGPPQTGAIYTAGFSVCSNGSLALGASAVFYKCQSGNFFNLYDRSWAAQCSPVRIQVMPCGGANAVAQSGDGQVVGTTVVPTTVVIPLSDGQPQVVTTRVSVPMCQIGDGQVQVHTTPCASVTMRPTSTAVPVSQFSDGQIQVTTTQRTSPGGSSATATSAGSTSRPATSAPSSSSAASTMSTTARPTSSSSTGTAPPVSTVTRSAAAIRTASAAALAVGIFGALWLL